MWSRLLATLLFYRQHAAASLCITMGCAYVVYSTAGGLLSMMLAVKLLSAWIILYFLKEFRPNSMFFYNNLGFSQRAVWIASLVVDLILFYATGIGAIILSQ
ncbi:MAG: hypothetical protein R2813_09495 [Flavobacteriales bacterium]